MNNTPKVNQLHVDIFTAAVMGTQAFKDGKVKAAGANLALMKIVYAYKTDSGYDHKCRCKIMRTYTNNWILAKEEAEKLKV